MGRIEPVTPEVKFITIEVRAGGYQALVTSDKGIKIPVGDLSITPEKARGSATKILSENLELLERDWAKQGHTFRKAAESMKVRAGNPVSKKQLEQAKREAAEEIVKLVKESRSIKDALATAKAEAKMMEEELGRRTIPYGADFWTKRGRYKQRYFADIPGAILYAKFLVYKDFVEELEPIVEEVDECIRTFSYDEVKQMALAEKISTAGGKNMMCKELWKRGWRVRDGRLQLL